MKLTFPLSPCVQEWHGAADGPTKRTESGKKSATVKTEKAAMALPKQDSASRASALYF